MCGGLGGGGVLKTGDEAKGDRHIDREKSKRRGRLRGSKAKLAVKKTYGSEMFRNVQRPRVDFIPPSQGLRIWLQKAESITKILKRRKQQKRPTTL